MVNITDDDYDEMVRKEEEMQSKIFDLPDNHQETFELRSKLLDQQIEKDKLLRELERMKNRKKRNRQRDESDARQPQKRRNVRNWDADGRDRESMPRRGDNDRYSVARNVSPERRRRDARGESRPINTRYFNPPKDGDHDRHRERSRSLHSHEGMVPNNNHHHMMPPPMPMHAPQFHPPPPQHIIHQIPPYGAPLQPMMPPPMLAPQFGAPIPYHQPPVPAVPQFLPPHAHLHPTCRDFALPGRGFAPIDNSRKQYSYDESALPDFTRESSASAPKTTTIIPRPIEDRQLTEPPHSTPEFISAGITNFKILKTDQRNFVCKFSYNNVSYEARGSKAHIVGASEEGINFLTHPPGPSTYSVSINAEEKQITFVRDIDPFTFTCKVGYKLQSIAEEEFLTRAKLFSSLPSCPTKKKVHTVKHMLIALGIQSYNCRVEGTFYCNLTQSRNDAAKIGEVCEQMGFAKIVDLSNENILTWDDLQRRITHSCRYISLRDYAITFYFSGHGGLHHGQMSIVLPHGIVPIANIISQLKGAVVFNILDCCREALPAMSRNDDKTPPPLTGCRWVNIYATHAANQAWESGSGDLSLYTHTLTSVISTKLENREPITIESLFDETSNILKERHSVGGSIELSDPSLMTTCLWR